MSDAALTRDEEMLARLAEMDFAAAEKAHAKLMAADEASEIAALGLTYQRLSRTLRQTLALKARRAREAADRAAWLAARAPWPPAGGDAFPGWETDRRMEELQDAVGRVIAATTSDHDAQAGLYDRFDGEVDDWVEHEDFATADLDRMVLAAARVLGLSEALASSWRDLPQAPDRPDPAERDDDDPDAADPLPALRRDSG